LNTNALEVKTVLLPLNSTSLLQATYQGAISTFNAYYIRTTHKGIPEDIQVSGYFTLKDD
jgi:hypothetical protein